MTMNIPFSQRRVGGPWGLVLLAGLAVGFVGCQGSADSEAFQEYSTIEGDCESAAKEEVPEPESSGEEIPEPAIAEKPFQPAIAQASYERSTIEVSTTGDPAVKSDEIEVTKADSKSEPREIKLLVPEKEFKKVGPEGALRVSYDDIDLLKVLNMDPVPVDVADHLPEWLEELDGQRIRIRGFMFPPYQDTDIPYFVLARDNQICCFGRDPKRYDVIDVIMRKGTTTDYIQNRPFDVVGIFRIQPEANRGELYQLYVIEDAQVITDNSRR